MANEGSVDASANMAAWIKGLCSSQTLLQMEAANHIIDAAHAGKDISAAFPAFLRVSCMGWECTGPRAKFWEARKWGLIESADKLLWRAGLKKETRAAVFSTLIKGLNDEDPKVRTGARYDLERYADVLDRKTVSGMIADVQNVPGQEELVKELEGILRRKSRIKELAHDCAKSLVRAFGRKPPVAEPAKVEPQKIKRQ
jgi:hypothetical protein